ncbi:MAG: Slp family lipoprotein [Dokdonella sp.]
MATSRFGLLALSFALATAEAFAAQDVVRDAVMLDVASAARDNHQGATVLWGGQIVSRSDANGQACIEVAATPLDRKDGKPDVFSRRAQLSAGPRFIACGDALDSPAFAIGKLATLAGTLGPTQERPCSEPGTRGSISRGALERQTANGCVREVPVVAVADSRSWNDLRAGRQPQLLQPMYPFN